MQYRSKPSVDPEFTVYFVITIENYMRSWKVTLFPTCNVQCSKLRCKLLKENRLCTFAIFLVMLIVYWCCIGSHSGADTKIS